MIDEVVKRAYIGAGCTILLGWIPVLNILFALADVITVLEFPKLKNVPTSQSGFKGVFGFVFFTICLIPAYLALVLHLADSHVTVIIVTVIFYLPQLVILITLFFQKAVYQKYTYTLDEFLIMVKNDAIDGSAMLNRNKLANSLYYGNRKMNPQEITQILNDLQENDVITYTSDPQTDTIEIKITAPELQKYFIGETTLSDVSSSIANQAKWHCGYCNGKNEIKKNEDQLVCRFCGAARS